MKALPSGHGRPNRWRKSRTLAGSSGVSSRWSAAPFVAEADEGLVMLDGRLSVDQPESGGQVREVARRGGWRGRSR